MTYSGQAMIHDISKAKHEPCYKQAEMHYYTKTVLHVPKLTRKSVVQYCTADEHLCFCFMDSTIPLLFKSGTSTSSFQPSSATHFMLDLVGNPKKDVFS